jgi:DNA repair protein RecO (recombination protein O)
MERREEHAIVLDSRVSGETGKLVSLLTEHGQLLQAFAPGAGGSRKRFGGALEPGARVRARWSVSREGGGARLEEAVLEHAPPRPDPLERLYATAHLVDLARAFARQGFEEPRLYRLVASCLGALERAAEVDPLLRYAELWVLRLAGLWPDLGQCAVCGRPLGGRPRWLAPDLGAVCAEHRGPAAQRLDASAAEWALRAGRTPPDAVPAPREADGGALRRVLTRWIVSFTDRPLTSLEALERLRRGAKSRRRAR